MFEARADWRVRQRVLLSSLLVLAFTLALIAVQSIVVRERADAVAGVPAAPTTVYAEDFENGMTASATGAKSLTSNTLGAAQYTGANGMTYYADANWREGVRCSGIVLAYSNGDAGTSNGGGGPAWATTGATAGGSTMSNKCSASLGVQSYNSIRTIARAMGSVVGGGDANHMVSTYTECAQNGVGDITSCDTLPTGPTTSRMFETQQQITVTPNHYYTFAVDAAASNCGTGTAPETADPRYQFQLLNGATRTNIGSALNACRDSSRVAFNVNRPRQLGGAGGPTNLTGYVTRLKADSAFMYPGSSLGIAMYDATGVTAGNDGGFDNVRLQDVTPAIDKSFSPALVEPNQTSVLTLTITNRTDLLAKTDWGFVDTLPTGLTLANNTFGGTCAQKAGAAFTRTGATGGSTITVTGGDLALGDTSCTITATVTSSTENTYTNSPTQNMTLTGLVPGDPGTVQFLAPRIKLVKDLGSARVKAGDQFSVAIRTGSGTGTVVSSGANAATQGTGSTVTGGTGTTGTYVATSTTSYFLTESGVAQTDLALYDATLTCVDSTGRTTGLPTNVASTGNSSITPAIGADITCTLTNKAVAPTIRVTKALDGARAASNDQFKVAIHTGSATGPVVNATANDTTTGAGSTVTSGTGTTGTYTASVGTAYYLTEAASGTTTLTNYTKTISCTDSAGIQAGLPTNAPLGSALQITPVPAAKISCTITNKATRPDVFLHKVGEDQSGSTVSLAGSAWQLQADANGTPGATVTGGVQPVAGQTGEFRMTGLLPGSYWLTETTAPSGYTLLAQQVRFTVAADGTVSLVGGSTAAVSLGSTAGGDAEITVHDPRALTLPLAGGGGAKPFALVGLLLLVVAGAVLLILWRRSASGADTGRRVRTGHTEK